MPPQANGADRIKLERERQIVEEGYSTKHDDEHTDMELPMAAVCYALYGGSQAIPPSWPWQDDEWKPSTDYAANLVKAGALIAAEIDRYTRARAGTS